MLSTATACRPYPHPGFDDDNAWWPMPACSLPATLARHLGLRELHRGRHHLDLGGAPGRANTGDKMMTLAGFRAYGGGRTASTTPMPARRRDGRCSRRAWSRRHPPWAHLPAQLPVGPCPSTRPREPPVVGPGPGRWGRTRRLAPDHRTWTRPSCETYRLAKACRAPPRLTGARGYHQLLAVASNGTGEVLMAQAAARA